MSFKQPYLPSEKILKNYADVLINFALGGGKGIKKGEVVRVSASESAKPLYLAVFFHEIIYSSHHERMFS